MGTDRRRLILVLVFLLLPGLACAQTMPISSGAGAAASGSGVTPATCPAGQHMAGFSDSFGTPVCEIAPGAPGGSTTQCQYNNAGAFGGDAGCTYNAATDTMTLGGMDITGAGRAYTEWLSEAQSVSALGTGRCGPDTDHVIKCSENGGAVTPLLKTTARSTDVVDLSAATSTKPVKTGTALPGTCGTGELFFDTDATAGQNVYGCIANVWTLLSGTGSGTVTSVGLTMPGIFSVTGSPVTTAGTLAVAALGTSGGIPYFNAATTLASSAALTANLPVIGGGAGVAPTVGTRSGNTTAFVTTTGAQTSGRCVEIDASGNHIQSAAGCAGAPAFNTVTPGTNTGALVIGAGGSLLRSGNGIVDASLFKGNTTAAVPDGGTGLVTFVAKGAIPAATAATTLAALAVGGNGDKLVADSSAATGLAWKASPEYGGVATGTNTYVATLAPAPATIATGKLYSFLATNANTGASTINFNGLGACPIRKSNSAELVANDIRAGQVILVQYNGASCQMQSLLGNTAGGSGDMLLGSPNTMGAAGTIDLSAAPSLTGLRIPNAAGAVPVGLGVLAYDTTKDAPVVGQNAGGSSTTKTAYFQRFIDAVGPSATLDAGTVGTTETDFSVTHTLPANYCVAGKVSRFQITMQAVSPGAAVSRTYKIKFGSAVLFSSGASTPSNNVTRGYSALATLRCTSTGASGTLDIGVVGALSGGTATMVNTITQPFTVDTTVSNVLALSVTFGVGTAGNTDTLRMFTWEELN